MKQFLLALTFASTCLSPMTWANSSQLSATTSQPLYALEGKPILGRVENVFFEDIAELEEIAFTGKIDTGADTTSMHAADIHTSSSHPDYQHLKDDELLWAVIDDLGGTKAKWDESTFTPYKLKVSFTIHHPYTGQEIEVSDDLERVSAIRSRSSDTPMLRPTIQLPLTIAGRTVMTDINLADRSDFSSPILIGKSFLEENAWVFAGYDYLQQQPKAQLIGSNESVTIDGLPHKISYSAQNNYSSLHAKNIQVDLENYLVSFDIEGSNGKHKAMQLPFYRMLTVSGEERPMVFAPVETGKGTQYWLVYLTDRSKYSSQIRLGKETLNKHFLIDTNRRSQLGKAPVHYSTKSKALLVSAQEQIVVDGIALEAKPSLTVKTPLLKVHRFEMYQDQGKPWVRYSLKNSKGKTEFFTKPINKKLRVGGSIRPVVFGTFTVNGQQIEMPYALEKTEEGEPQQHFVIGRNTSKHGVLVNTRTEHLLTAYPLFKAGHIETVEVEGLSFPAKLDTGADVSSINAQNIERFKKNGKPMVRFTYQNESGAEQEFEREVVDVMRIKARAGEEANERPVVEMQVKLADLEKRVRVNLQDRSRFGYSMILGKNFLQYGAIVSSDNNYIATKKRVE